MGIAYSYTLKRVDNVGESFRSDMNIVELARKRAQKKHKRKYIEQDLGTDPIPVKDFLYKRLEI